MAIATALTLSAVACGGAERPHLAEPETTVSRPPGSSATIRSPNSSTVAEARVPSVPVFDEPTAAKAARQLANPQESGAPLVFLVQEQRVGWMKVSLPVRPNGSTGWVRQGDVTTYQHEYRMVIEIGAHRITVYKGGDVFVQEPIGVGTQDTPTPGGVYYTKELIQPIDDSGKLNPNGPYGPYAYGLSGFPNVLYDFAGGDGVIGIHGTNDPSSIGRDVSHGCIRMSNAGITKLAKALPLGVPVEIRA